MSKPSPSVGSRRKMLAKRIMRDGRAFHPDAKHGTKTGYDYYGCRCDECGLARRLLDRQAKEDRRAFGDPRNGWTRADSLALDAWALSQPARTPLQIDPDLYAAFHAESVAA